MLLNRNQKSFQLSCLPSHSSLSEEEARRPRPFCKACTRLERGTLQRGGVHLASEQVLVVFAVVVRHRRRLVHGALFRRCFFGYIPVWLKNLSPFFNKYFAASSALVSPLLLPRTRLVTRRAKKSFLPLLPRTRHVTCRAKLRRCDRGWESC